MIKYNWTDQQEQLLISWAEKSSGYSWLHSKSMNHYRYKNMYISIPAAVLSYLAGSSSLIFSNNVSHDNCDVSYNIDSPTTNVENNKHDNRYKYLCVGFAGIIAGILVNFQEVFKFKELSEQHRISSLRHLTFFRDISTELSLHPRDRHKPIEYIKTKKLEFGKMLEQSPIVPQKIIKHFEEKFKKVKIHKPDVATNLQTIMAYADRETSPNECDMEDISNWLKKKRVNNSMIEIANSNSDCESNSEMVEVVNSDEESINHTINCMV